MKWRTAGLVLLPTIAAAQGFPWELSPRLPAHAPTLFLGTAIHIAYTPSVAALEAIEGEWTCATYRHGTGWETSLGVHAEWWYASQSAFRSTLAVEQAALRFAAPSQPLPLRDGRLLLTEYQLRSNFWLARVEVAMKQRLWSWLWLSLGGWMALQWRVREEQWEVVLSPSDYQFRTFPPSRQRRLEQAHSIDLRPYGAGIHLRIGYDLILARRFPFYAAPAIVLGSSIISLAKAAAWQRWEAGVELPLFWGLPRH
ncbi:MAG: hypothetical protein NZ473_07375 [Candidatus Kapabacteria bacterium]|nr:hypothetical protein [Candidatus Kapabacteria bacterium]MCS7169663.1 hypothetical protein [Candidatus Kapabacteria bacterium]MDW7996719.1 hypothetical protein [Bacteroidota bacterium]MDW8224577.1 hypothetical protein [Bacteroidota bacterium]